MTTQEISNRSRIRQWVREHIEGEEEVSIPDLATLAVTEFGHDRRFLNALANECLRDMVMELARQTVQSTRGQFLAGDTITTAEAIKRRGRQHSVFAAWLEHVGDRHIRLMDMTREDLLSAATEREQRGEHEIQLAALWRTMAQRLEGGQSVKERFTAEEIAAMQAGLHNS